jgi:hypothetical protein
MCLLWATQINHEQCRTRWGIAGERLLSHDAVLKLVSLGQTASKDAEFEGTTKSNEFETLPIAAGVG